MKTSQDIDAQIALDRLLIPDGQASIIEQKLAQVQRDYKLRSQWKFIATIAALFFTVLALFSLMGYISHSEWIPIHSAGSIFEKISMTVFQSGQLGMGIFSGTALLLWGLRTRL